MSANLVLTWRLFINKRMVFWPLAVIPLAYQFYTPMYLCHNLVSCKSIAKNCSICATWGKIFIWELSATKSSPSATKSLMLRISDHLKNNINIHINAPIIPYSHRQYKILARGQKSFITNKLNNKGLLGVQFSFFSWQYREGNLCRRFYFWALMIIKGYQRNVLMSGWLVQRCIIMNKNIGESEEISEEPDSTQLR